MTDERIIPPAVAEFAVEERAQLLERIAELEACAESLRLKANHAGLEVIEYRRRNAELINELYALKAKSSGVVLLEHKTAADFSHYHDESWRVELAEVSNLLLDEVARLNLSPASAGEIPFAGFDPNFCPGSNPENPQYPDEHEPSAGGVDDRAVFAAGVKAASDHVKAIVDDYDYRHGSTDPDTGTREYPGNGEEWVGQMLELIEDFTGIVAPAALSAPSHGEQDRLRQRLAEREAHLMDAVELLSEAETLIPKHGGHKMHAAWRQYFAAFIPRIGYEAKTDKAKSLLITAPSAGSQGGDV